MAETNKAVDVILFDTSFWSQEAAEVIVESPVSLTVNGELWLTFMCTPVHLEAMAVGFLFNEGIIQSKDQVADVRLCPAGDNVDVWLTHAAEKPEKWRRTSDCTGGVTSIENLESLQFSRQAAEAGNSNPQNPDTGQQFHNQENGPGSTPSIQPAGLTLTPEQVTGLIGKLFEAQELYRRSGGVHTSALADSQDILVTSEDIGRHNTLDKIAGRLLLEELQPAQRIILTTGRISSEMLQKSARMGAHIIISRTSPSSLSVHLAEAWDVTLIGYAKRTGFRIYTHPERILTPEISTQTPVDADNTSSTVIPLKNKRDPLTNL